jgi:hypothetical protein
MPDLIYKLDIAAFMVAWVIGAALVGVAAGRRGFLPLAWGLASLVVSPVVGFVLLTLVTPRHNQRPRS